MKLRGIVPVISLLSFDMKKKTSRNDFRARLLFFCSSVVLKCWHLYEALIPFALILSFGVEVAKYYKLTNIGVVFDITSPVGKVEKTAVEAAVQDFNTSLFMNPGSNPLKATITEKPVEEMNIWEEGVSVAANGKTSSASPTQSSINQLFLVKVTINDFEHGKCFTTIIHVNSWSRVLRIFKEESYVVFIPEPSRTARGSSIPMSQQLEPNISDIERLEQANSNIGLAGDSFVRTYFAKELGFETQNIEDSSSKYKYEGQLRSINRSTDFLDLPRWKISLSQHRKQFIAANRTDFVDFNLAYDAVVGDDDTIVRARSRFLMRIGAPRSLEENRSAYSPQFSAHLTPDSESLALRSFWGIYLVFGVTSTVCLLFFLINLIRSYCYEQDETQDNLPP